MSRAKSYRWIVPIVAAALAALLLVPYIMWKYVAARNLKGSETYSNVRYMPEVKGKVGMELHLEFTGTRVTATLADYDGTEQVLRTFLKGSTEGRRLQLQGTGPSGAIEITGSAEAAVFDGFITRRIDPKSDPVQHPLLLKRVPSPGENAPEDQ
jgi:hypothetical protein